MYTNLKLGFLDWRYRVRFICNKLTKETNIQTKSVLIKLNYWSTASE